MSRAQEIADNIARHWIGTPPAWCVDVINELRRLDAENKTLRAPLTRTFPDGTFVFDENDFLYRKGLHDGKNRLEPEGRRQPLDDNEVVSALQNLGRLGYGPYEEGFDDGVRFAESWHGIGKPAEQEPGTS